MPHPHHRSQGFTLIELMIVVAIVGILASLAVPTFGNQMKKARVAELLAAATVAKAGVAEYFTVHGALPANGDVQLSGGGTDNVTSVAWNGTTITITGTALVEGLILNITPDASSEPLTWTCETPNGASDEQLAILPSNCTQAAA